jgi:hypothetical protein
MKRFAQLYAELDATTSTAAKVEALERYLAQAPAADAAWAVYFLSGGKPRQVVRTSVLRALACELAALPDWLFEASYQAVGDLAETIAHVLPPGSGTDDALLAEWVQERMLPLRGMAEPEPGEAMASALIVMPAATARSRAAGAGKMALRMSGPSPAMSIGLLCDHEAGKNLLSAAIVSRCSEESI